MRNQRRCPDNQIFKPLNMKQHHVLQDSTILIYSSNIKFIDLHYRILSTICYTNIDIKSISYIFSYDFPLIAIKLSILPIYDRTISIFFFYFDKYQNSKYKLIATQLI